MHDIEVTHFKRGRNYAERKGCKVIVIAWPTNRSVCFVSFYFCFNFMQENLVIPRRIWEWLETNHKTSEKKKHIYLYFLLFEVKVDIIYIYTYMQIAEVLHCYHFRCAKIKPSKSSREFHSTKQHFAERLG